jgi:hypothetical protein
VFFNSFTLKKQRGMEETLVAHVELEHDLGRSNNVISGSRAWCQECNGCCHSDTISSNTIFLLQATNLGMVIPARMIEMVIVPFVWGHPYNAVCTAKM